MNKYERCRTLEYVGWHRHRGMTGRAGSIRFGRQLHKAMLSLYKFGMKLFYPRAHFTRSPTVPGLNGVCGLSLPGAGMAFAGGPLSGPLAIPLRRARLSLDRLCRRRPGGRIRVHPIFFDLNRFCVFAFRRSFVLEGYNRDWVCSAWMGFRTINFPLLTR